MNRVQVSRIIGFTFAFCAIYFRGTAAEIAFIGMPIGIWMLVFELAPYIVRNLPAFLDSFGEKELQAIIDKTVSLVETMPPLDELTERENASVRDQRNVE